MYIDKITYCGLLPVKPVMDMIEQMMGVQSFYVYKMGYTTVRSLILLVDIKETQISLSVLTITTKVFCDNIMAILSAIVYQNTGKNICFLPIQMGEKIKDGVCDSLNCFLGYKYLHVLEVKPE